MICNSLRTSTCDHSRSEVKLNAIFLSAVRKNPKGKGAYCAI